MEKGNQTELKPEWIVFSQEYIIDWDRVRAYRKAYPKCKSDEAAAVSASRLLKNDKIKTYISEIQLDLAKMAGVSALRNILELKKIAYANVSDFRDNWGKLKEWDQIPDELKAALSEVVVVNRTDKDGNPIIIKKYKLQNKIKAIEVLNEMLGWKTPTEIKHSGEVDLPLFMWADQGKK
mgnify:CR=1 FL=1